MFEVDICVNMCLWCIDRSSCFFYSDSNIYNLFCLVLYILGGMGGTGGYGAGMGGVGGYGAGMGGAGGYGGAMRNYNMSNAIDIQTGTTSLADAPVSTGEVIPTLVAENAMLGKLTLVSESRQSQYKLEIVF